MTTEADVYQAFQTALAVGFQGVPIGWENQDFKPPVIQGDAEPWGSAEVEFVPVLGGLGGGSGLISIGGLGDCTYRTWGHLRVHVFVPRKTGRMMALNAASTIGHLFRGRDLGQGIICTAYSVPQDGGHADDAGAWYRVTVQIEFYFEDQG